MAVSSHSDWNLLLLKLAQDLEKCEDLKSIRFLLKDNISVSRDEEIQDGIDLMKELGRLNLDTPDRLTKLMEDIGRRDLMSRIEKFLKERGKNKSSVGSSASITENPAEILRYQEREETASIQFSTNDPTITGQRSSLHDNGVLGLGVLSSNPPSLRDTLPSDLQMNRVQDHQSTKDEESSRQRDGIGLPTASNPSHQLNQDWRPQLQESASPNYQVPSLATHHHPAAPNLTEQNSQSQETTEQNDQEHGPTEWNDPDREPTAHDYQTHSLAALNDIPVRENASGELVTDSVPATEIYTVPSQSTTTVISYHPEVNPHTQQPLFSPPPYLVQSHPTHQDMSLEVSRALPLQLPSTFSATSHPSQLSSSTNPPLQPSDSTPYPKVDLSPNSCMTTTPPLAPPVQLIIPDPNILYSAPVSVNDNFISNFSKLSHDSSSNPKADLTENSYMIATPPLTPPVQLTSNPIEADTEPASKDESFSKLSNDSSPIETSTVGDPDLSSFEEITHKECTPDLSLVKKGIGPTSTKVTDNRVLDVFENVVGVVVEKVIDCISESSEPSKSKSQGKKGTKPSKETSNSQNKSHIMRSISANQIPCKPTTLMNKHYSYPIVPATAATAIKPSRETPKSQNKSHIAQRSLSANQIPSSPTVLMNKHYSYPVSPAPAAMVPDSQQYNYPGQSAASQQQTAVANFGGTPSGYPSPPPPTYTPHYGATAYPHPLTINRSVSYPSNSSPSTHTQSSYITSHNYPYPTMTASEGHPTVPSKNTKKTPKKPPPTVPHTFVYPQSK